MTVRAATSAPAWFAVRTRSRHEQVVRHQLERKEVETFLPTVTRWSRWKDRRKRIAWPLFPGYCFARFDPDRPLAIVACAGVVGIGAQIDVYRQRLWGSELIASIILASLLGLSVFLAFGWLARKVVGRWHEPVRGQ